MEEGFEARQYHAYHLYIKCVNESAQILLRWCDVLLCRICNNMKANWIRLGGGQVILT